MQVKNAQMAVQQHSTDGVHLVVVPDEGWGAIGDALATVLKTMNVPVHSAIGNITSREDAAVHAFLVSMFSSPGIVILVSHACPESFGSQDGSLVITWEEFARAADWSPNDKVVILLGCKTGRGEVAAKLFNSSKTIAGVIGVPRETSIGDLVTACTMFFHAAMRGTRGNKILGEINKFCGKPILEDFSRGSWKVHLHTVLDI